MFALAAIDQGPLARLAEVMADETAPSVVFGRLTDGERPETLRDIARAWGLPKGKFVEWFTTQHAELYDAALKVRADDLAHGALECADGATPETVGVEKLRSDVRMKLASKWDRKRYGDDAAQGLAAPVTIQIANLRGAPLEITAGAAKVSLQAVGGEKNEAPI